MRMVKKMSVRSKEIRNTLLLILAAFIWGTTFVAQSIGADHVGPFTFLAGRSWIGCAFLLPVILTADQIRKKKTEQSGAPKSRAERKALLLAGAACGTLLFAAAYAQQAGIATTTTAKCGFETAMYVVIVPILSVFIGKRPSARIWLCVALGVAGLYFLCLTGAAGFVVGDGLSLLSAFLFALQILAVGHFVQRSDGIRLSFWQFFFEAVLSTVFLFLFESPSAADLRAALFSILYAGVLSSGVAYTLQTVAEKDLNPTLASLAMCLESVFSALAGWAVLNQRLTAREIFGCVLMFAAIVLAQLPGRPAHRRREAD